MKQRKNEFFWALLVMLTALLPFLLILLDSDAVLLFRDLTNVYLPVKATWVRGFFALGRIPLWDPYHGGGRPFLPDLNGGPLYPLNFLLLPFGPDHVARGAVFFIAAHHALMALGFYLLLRRLRCRIEVAAAGAFVFAWSGFSLSADNLFQELGGITAMPFFFLFLLSARGGRLLSHYSLLASIALAWALYAGNAEMVYLACLIAPVFLWKNSIPRAVAQLAVIAALTCLAAAPQLGPTLAYLARSTREFDGVATEMRDQFQLAWSLHPARLLELLFPYAFGPSGTVGWGNGLVNASNQSIPFVLCLYAGSAFAVPLFLLTPAWLKHVRRWEARSFLAIAVWVTLTLLALGQYSPLPVYRAAVAVLPVWERFRYPERLAFWTAFFWILACAVAFERVLRLKPSRKSCAQAAAVFLALGLVFFGVFKSWESALHAVVAFTAAAAALALPKHRARALLLVAAIDMLVVSRHVIWPQSSAFVQLQNLPFVSKVSDDLSRNAQAIRGGEPQRVFTMDLLRGSPSSAHAKMYDLESAGKWSYLLYNTNAYWGIEAASGFFALQVGKTLLERMPETSNQMRRALDLMSVRYLLTLDRDGNQINVSRSAVPFASLPSTLKWVHDVPGAIHLLRDPHYSYQNSALLEGEAPAAEPGWGWRLKSVQKKFDHIAVDLEAAPDAGRWLLLSETFSPNWAARDRAGKALPVRLANAWAMGIGLPAAKPGELQTVLLDYAEPSFRVGLMGLLAWLVIAMLVWRNAVQINRPQVSV
jgi:hypothetical protein